MQKHSVASAGAQQASTKLIKEILLIEDNPGDVRLLREMFDEYGAHNTEMTHVDCMSAAEQHLGEHEVDIILLDPGLPDAQGLGSIRRAHAAAPRIPLVVLTCLDDESVAEQALQEGAQDYLIKGQVDVRGVLRALRYATERSRLERLKDEFVSTVSHELRTPLTSISGSLGLLMGNAAGDLPKPMARLLAIAHTNSQRLVRLVNDILDIEKMQAGRVVFNFRRVEVRPLVAQAIEANRGFAESYGVRVRLEDGPPPQTCGPIPTGCSRSSPICFPMQSNFLRRMARWWSRSRREPTWFVSRCAITARASRPISSPSFSRNSPKPTPGTRGRKAVPVLA